VKAFSGNSEQAVLKDIKVKSAENTLSCMLIHACLQTWMPLLYLWSLNVRR